MTKSKVAYGPLLRLAMAVVLEVLHWKPSTDPHDTPGNLGC